MKSATENTESRLLGARTERVAGLRLIGRATFKLSGDLREFGMAAVRDKFEALILDFNDCTSVDSTILGVIAMIGLEGRGTTAIIAVNAKPSVRKQLEGVGLSKLLRFSDTDAEGLDWAGLCAAAAGSIETEDLADTMLEAHEALMNLDQRNIPVFRDVVELLKEQSKTSKPES
ncbi:MAG: STAS domain-containing protein [Verrucomicrobiota bacterium]